MTAMLALNGIAWDMDGTLLDTERLKKLAHQRTIKAFGAAWTVSDEMYLTIVGTSAHEAMRRITRRCGIYVPTTEYQEIWHRHYLDLVHAGVELHPGVPDLLDLLNKFSLTQAIVTSSTREEALDVLKLTGIIDKFAHVISADDVEHHKPHPAPYQLALKRMQLHPNEVVAVEDTDSGVAAAQGAGLRVLALRHSMNTKQTLAANWLSDTGRLAYKHTFYHSLRALEY